MAISLTFITSFASAPEIFALILSADSHTQKSEAQREDNIAKSHLTKTQNKRSV